MSNYDGIDRLSPDDEPLLDQDRRDWGRRYAEMCETTECVFCGGPNDTQTGTCVRCEVVAERGREWDEGAA